MAIVTGFFLGRSALQAGNQKQLRLFGLLVLSDVPLQMLAEFLTLQNPRWSKIFYMIRFTELLVVTAFVIYGFQLILAILAVVSAGLPDCLTAKRTKCQQTV